MAGSVDEVELVNVTVFALYPIVTGCALMVMPAPSRRAPVEFSAQRKQQRKGVLRR